MGKRLIWSKKAQQDRKDIFEYWNTRNQSTLYSQKLNRLFKKTLAFACEFPQLGKPTDYDEHIRVCFVRDYLLFYEILPNEILVLRIWHGKQENINQNKY